MKTRIGIYGGTFSPPTRGHMQIADALVRRNILDKVYLMPNYITYGKDAVSAQHRLHMVKLACREFDGVDALDFEITQGIAGGTFEVMNLYLQTCGYWTDTRFIIGQDTADDLLTWDEDSHKLPDLLPFVVIHRGVQPPDSFKWYMKEPHQYIDDIELSVSSTHVRDLLAREEHESLFRKVPFSVLDYIYHYNLYRS